MIKASKPAILALILILAVVSYFVPFKPLSILSVILLALIAIWIILEKHKPGITNRILKNLGETKILLKGDEFTLSAPAADVSVKTTGQAPFALIDGSEVAITDGIEITRDSKEVRKIELFIPSSLKKISLSLVSGDLDAREIRCESLHAYSVSGNVRLTYIRSGELETRSVSGDVEITSASAQTMKASSTSGDVDIRDHRGDNLSASSISGDVDAETDGRDITCSTTSGSIDIKYTGTSGPTVSASSTSGSWEVFGRTGTGSFTETGTDGSIKAKSISGDIRIRG